MTDNNKDTDEDIHLDDDIIIDDHLVDDLEDDISDEAAVNLPEISKDDTSIVKTKKVSDGIKDPEVDAAVNDIVAKEADIVLEAEDEYRNATDIAEPEKKKTGFRALIKSIWSDPKKRWSVIMISIISLLVVGLVPGSRYFVLNTAGIRASVELRVLDSATLQPLKNVSVKAANAEVKTDSDGFARLESVKLGKTDIKIEKRAFAEQSKPLVVGWGSNPLGEFNINPVGTQYTFLLTDYLSGKPVVKGEVSYEDGNAISDNEGKAVLVLDTSDIDDGSELGINVKMDKYRDEFIKTSVNNREAQSVQMVSSKPHVFVSKRSGNFDVYAIDVDGKNERRVLSGEGFERDDITLSPKTDSNLVAYVATRENVRNQNGYLLSTLYILDIDKKDVIKIDQSEQIKVIGWSKDGRLVYVKIAAGASGNDPGRHRLMSFNSNDYNEQNKELAASNSFNDVIMAGDNVLYAPSNIFNENDKPAMYSIRPDGGDKKTIISKEVYSIVRGDYDTIYLNSDNEWNEYVLGSPMTSVVGPPAVQKTRLYSDNPYTKFSAWVDLRDGKGVLISYDRSTMHEKILAEVGGLKQPIYWLNESSIVYRVANGRETADYIVSTDGGEPRKIVDTTDTVGISSWYYY